MIAVAALLLGACASNDADRGDVVDTLTEADVPERQAECAADRFEDEFNQDQLNDLAQADEPNEVSDSVWQDAQAILDECIGSGEGGSAETTEGGDGSSTTSTTAEGGEPSETTGEETTTSTAASG